LYRLIAKIACLNSGFFLSPLRLAVPAPAATSTTRPGPAQTRLSSTNQPSLQVAALRMIAAAGNSDFC
jgi:hypothetical protein